MVLNLTLQPSFTPQVPKKLTLQPVFNRRGPNNVVTVVSVSIFSVLLAGAQKVDTVVSVNSLFCFTSQVPKKFTLQLVFTRRCPKSLHYSPFFTPQVPKKMSVQNVDYNVCSQDISRMKVKVRQGPEHQPSGFSWALSMTQLSPFFMLIGDPDQHSGTCSILK